MGEYEVRWINVYCSESTFVTGERSMFMSEDEARNHIYDASYVGSFEVKIPVKFED